MAVLTRTQLKALFERGDKPTEANFSDWIDSYIHIEDSNDKIFTGSAGVEKFLTLTSDITGQTGTAAFTGIDLVVDTTARAASGATYFIRLAEENGGETDKFTVDLEGNTTIAGQLLASDGTTSLPGISFASDPDSGFYYVSNSLSLAFQGTSKWIFESGVIRSSSTAGPYINHSTVSNIVPGFAPYRGSNNANINTGVGGIGTDLSLITAGIEALNVDASQNLSGPGSLTFAEDTDETFIFGRARIDSRATDQLFISHYGLTTTNNYLASQDSLGNSFFNAASGLGIYFKIGNTTQWTLNSIGDLVGATGNDLTLTASRLVLGIYTVATLPTVIAGGFIYVSDEAGGATTAFSDGTNWRRSQDRVIVS